MTLKVVSDSTCDLPEAVIQALGITIIPVYINIGDRGYLDGVEITRQEFYVNLPNYTSHPTTGAPGPEAFRQVYERLAASGASEILSIHIGGSVSATVNVAQTGAKECSQAAIRVWDSRQLSLGTGFQVELAARMAREGKPVDEIVSALADMNSRTFVAARLETLIYLQRSGRMNAVMTGLGSLLQLKPIITMQEGRLGSERVRTIARAEARLIEMLIARQPVEKFALLHSNAPEQAEAFRLRSAHLIPAEQVQSIDITPVIGAHIGPGAVGFAVVSRKSKNEGSSE
ncbi:MAG TPA: DegV family protein [Anaerolineales bacterium]|nr:DegV family protein [Anaerolineales bacterium]